MLKKLKWNSIICAVLFIILGCILIAYPKTAAQTLCRMIGIILMIGGGVTIITYFFRPIDSAFYRNDFVIGMVEMMLGLIAVAKTKDIVSLIPVIFGIIVVISGLIKLQTAIDLHSLGASNQLPVIIMALINLLFGFLLIWAPFSPSLLMTYIGFCLLYSGITDFILAVWLSTKYREFNKQ